MFGASMTTTANNHSRRDLFLTLTLMLTIMIDVMGLGLVFPIYPDLLYNPKYTLVSLTMDPLWHNFLYGLALASWPIGLFLGAPYFGDLSDRLSRKHVIALCLFGVAITYVLSIVAVDLRSYGLFLCCRFLSGVFGGSFPIAQAMMIDISTPETKARNLSFITLAASIGFVIGPVITSITTLPQVAQSLSITSPFYVAAVMSFLNAVAVMFLLPCLPASNPAAKIRLLKSIGVIYEALTDVRIQKLLFVFLLLFIGWGFYVTMAALVLYEHFHYTTSGVAMVYATMALSNIVFTICVRPTLFARFSNQRICWVTGLLIAGLMLLSVWLKYIAIQWLVAALAPGLQLMFYTAILVLLSDAVSEVEQGKVMGSADAAASLAWVINSLLIGLFLDVNLTFPVVIGVIATVIASLYFLVKVREATSST